MLLPLTKTRTAELLKDEMKIGVMEAAPPVDFLRAAAEGQGIQVPGKTVAVGGGQVGAGERLGAENRDAAGRYPL